MIKRFLTEKSELVRFVIAALLFIAAFLIKNNIIKFMLFFISYLTVGFEVFKKAIKNIKRGQVFDENFLMGIASLGAFIVGEYPEGAAVMLFYQLGEMFQDYAVDKSRKSVAELMDLRPDYAHIEINGEIKTVKPQDVQINDTILVKPGEKIPLDGIVIDGISFIDTSALTGEAVPRRVQPKDCVLSGCINNDGVLHIKVTKKFAQSTVSKILELVENAGNKKSSSENFITKFARYYTPAVVIAAVLIAFVPPLILSQSLSQWIYRALIFLVISCPCALVISVPLSFFGGIGGASKAGILIKGSNYIEALSKTEIVAFDKTGTVTEGVFEVTKAIPSGITENDLLMLAAYAESYSNHPISLSLKKAYAKDINPDCIGKYEELPGFGIKAEVYSKEVLVGNKKLMDRLSIEYPHDNEENGTVVYVAVEKNFVGHLVISDRIKPDAAASIGTLKAAGIKTVMLTGDRTAAGNFTAKKLGIDEVYCELLPADKVAITEKLLNECRKNKTLVFVGDGINDAPVLARADIGIAMGALGSDAAIEAADVVIMNDEPSKITDAIKISKRTIKIAKQNIIFALAVKLLIMLLGAFGFANMWEAVFADVGVSIIAVLNSIRALNTKRV